MCGVGPSPWELPPKIRLGSSAQPSLQRRRSTSFTCVKPTYGPTLRNGVAIVTCAPCDATCSAVSSDSRSPRWLTNSTSPAKLRRETASSIESTGIEPSSSPPSRSGAGREPVASTTTSAAAAGGAPRGDRGRLEPGGAAAHDENAARLGRRLRLAATLAPHVGVVEARDRLPADHPVDAALV